MIKYKYCNLLKHDATNNSRTINAGSGFEPASENECHRPDIEDIYLCAALDFDLSHSWLSMAFEVLTIIIHVITAICIYGYSWKHH